MHIDQWEANLIGKTVRATMDGETWFVGTLTEVIDLFVPYRVRLDDTAESRLFAHIEEQHEW